MRQASNRSRRPKVAIVGGGAASLAAAWELAKQGSFDVTVYQMGWRLGGKGASGKNSDQSGRIEEHGLHVWMGFYENAFRMLRECYRELNEDWQEVFFPERRIGVVETDASGSWRPWISHLPPAPGVPGDPLTGDDNPFTLQSYFKKSIDLFRALLRSALLDSADSGHLGQGSLAGRPNPLQHDQVSFSDVSPRLVVDKIARLMRVGVLTTVAGLLEAVTLLEVVAGDRLSLDGNDYKVLQFVEAIADSARRQLQDVIAVDAEVRTKLDVAELVLATIVGIVRDGLLSHPLGLDAINGEDCRAWLMRHGASEHACRSGFVRALYDMAFASVKVDQHDTPGIAAGQAIRGAFRMFFTYRGALFWKMRGGMGDIVFAPLYRRLREKGVRFEFFHRLEQVVTNHDGPTAYVERLVFDVQAKLRRGRDEYLPLQGGCWPARPLAAQLDGGADQPFEAPYGRPVRQKTLVVQDDFDFVVLGISIEAVKQTCQSIIQRDPRWRRMTKHVRTVATQAYQVWLDQGMEELGWPHGPITLAGMDAAFDTWSDMTHVVPRESWREWPRSVAYFCSALPEGEQGLDLGASSDGMARVTRSVQQRARKFFREQLPRLWLQNTPEIRPAIRGEYMRANVWPSDRYVLSRPGSLAYRISPLDTNIDNMTIAGDWTDCGFNEGCVEAAVMSGLLAAHAISGAPALEDIVGYDHP